jgi:hypothetical protein
MANDILDILYTPVEVPSIPTFDRVRLNEWCVKNYNQSINNRQDGKKTTSPNIYPWNIVYARNNYIWKDDFNIQFPELAKYFYSAFYLEEKEITSVVLLPVKNNYTGVTYWHADPDGVGLRLYLENNEIDKNFLLIKPTVKRYNTRDELGPIPSNGVSPKIQEVIHSAKILKSNQAFYINNVRAIHAVNVEEPNLNRLAVLVFTGKRPFNFPKKTKDLILQSAEKFSDFAILWNPPR